MDTITPPTSRPPSPFLAPIVWGALLLSQGMIVLVSQTAVTKTLTAPDQPAASQLGAINPAIFFAVAIAQAAAAYFIPRLLLNAARKSLLNRPTQPSFSELTQTLLPVWIVRWALLESILMTGFLSSMLSAQPSAIYPFAAASLVGFILTFPTEEKFRASLQESYQS